MDTTCRTSMALPSVSWFRGSTDSRGSSRSLVSSSPRRSQPRSEPSWSRHYMASIPSSIPTYLIHAGHRRRSAFSRRIGRADRHCSTTATANTLPICTRRAIWSYWRRPSRSAGTRYCAADFLEARKGPRMRWLRPEFTSTCTASFGDPTMGEPCRLKDVLSRTLRPVSSRKLTRMSS